MIYDHENPLSEKELELLGEEDFDKFLDYIDQKAEHLKQFTKPLSSYHTKRYASLTSAQQGKTITDEELKKANDIGRKNELEAEDKVNNKLWKEKEVEMLKKTVKNVKTDRSQWFD
jgi:hypothetical protein|tara:strand:- start:284 stop:631 length:348 start_codon:yes stop_codon:yes gene_type:complete